MPRAPARRSFLFASREIAMARSDPRAMVDACRRNQSAADLAPHHRPRNGQLATSWLRGSRPEFAMPLTRSRYDGHAAWYDDWNKPHAERNASEIRKLLGSGTGLCLDLGCGTGHYFDILAASGQLVVGLDRSADQLRIAHGRSRLVVQGDAAALPFRDGTFATVAAVFISTDVDDFARVLTEAARVLRPDGRVAFYGVHPCFNGPHTQWLDDGGMIAHPTYRIAGWHRDAPWWGPYVRKRVGMRHHPLAELMNAFIGAGLLLEHVAELGDRSIPHILAVRARKPGGG